MKKNIYEILKQSFYEINEHYMKIISALALQAFLLIASFLFLPPFGFIVAFLVMIITQIGLAKYSLTVLNKNKEQIKQVAEINKHTFSHIITFIIKTFQIVFFGLFLIIPGLKKWLEFSQTDFVLADNPKLDTAEALLESRKLTHNSKGRVFMLFATHLFLSIVLIAFSASVVLITAIIINISKPVMIAWFVAMSVFLLCVLAMPFYTISRTILYENLKTISKFNKQSNKTFMQEVAQEFMDAFLPNKKKSQETSKTKTPPEKQALPKTKPSTKTTATKQTTVKKKTTTKTKPTTKEM